MEVNQVKAAPFFVVRSSPTSVTGFFRSIRAVRWSHRRSTPVGTSGGSRLCRLAVLAFSLVYLLDKSSYGGGCPRPSVPSVISTEDKKLNPIHSHNHPPTSPTHSKHLYNPSTTPYLFPPHSKHLLQPYNNSLSLPTTLQTPFTTLQQLPISSHHTPQLHYHYIH